MDPFNATFDSARLLEHAGWVRALARSLVPGDPARADDLAQQAWLAALERRPDTRRPLGGWFAEVLRNRAREERRGARRRGEREQTAARPEALPSTLDVVERLSVHRELVEAVGALAEPYRTTVLLRFFEELPPAEIARRQSVPVATVKTRLARALAQLRERLDRNHGGDGRAWLVALIPFSKPAGAATAGTLGALFVSTNLKIALAAAALVCGTAWFLWPSKAPEQAFAADAPAHEVELAAATKEPPRAPELVETSAASTRAAASAPVPAKEAAPAPAAEPLATVIGHVLDVEARPVAGVELFFRAGQRITTQRDANLPETIESASAPKTHSDGQGRFELAAPRVAGEIYASGRALSTVLSGICTPGRTQAEVVVVVAPRVESEGRVIDESGRPIEGARVDVELPKDFRTRFTQVLDASTELSCFVVTAADGRYAIKDLPAVEGSTLQVWREGYRLHREPATQLSERGRAIVLLRHEWTRGTVHGEVLDPRGERVEGARVSLGPEATTITDEQGEFTLAIPPGGTKADFQAVKQGFQPAFEPASPAIRAGDREAQEHVVLRLGPPPLELAGRVVDSDGKPQTGLRVWPGDATFFGIVDEIPTQVESLLGGAPMRKEIEAMLAAAPEGTNPEDALRNTPNACWNYSVTDGEGRFRVVGLIDRAYRLAVLDPKTVARFESGPFQAGKQNVTIVLPADLVYPRIAGRVADGLGRGVAGVSVKVTADLLKFAISESSSTSLHFPGPEVVTGAEGKFEIERVPREHAYLRLDGESILPLVFGRGSEGGLAHASERRVEDLLIAVSRRYHFQVEPSSEAALQADDFQVLGADGKVRGITTFAGNDMRRVDAVPLSGGRTEVLVVDELARTLVLRKEGKELLRVPLELAPGELAILRP